MRVWWQDGNSDAELDVMVTIMNANCCLPSACIFIKCKLTTVRSAEGSGDKKRQKETKGVFLCKKERKKLTHRRKEGQKVKLSFSIPDIPLFFFPFFWASLSFCVKHCTYLLWSKRWNKLCELTHTHTHTHTHTCTETKARQRTKSDKGDKQHWPQS